MCRQLELLLKGGQVPGKGQMPNNQILKVKEMFAPTLTSVQAVEKLERIGASLSEELKPSSSLSLKSSFSSTSSYPTLPSSPCTSSPFSSFSSQSRASPSLPSAVLSQVVLDSPLYEKVLCR